MAISRHMTCGEIQYAEETGLLVVGARRSTRPEGIEKETLPEPLVQVMGSDITVELCSNTWMEEDTMPFLTVIDQHETVWRLYPPVFPTHLRAAMEIIDAQATLKAGRPFGNSYAINITFPPTVEIDAEWQRKVMARVIEMLGVQYVYQLSYIRRKDDFYEFFLHTLDSDTVDHYNKGCGSDRGKCEIEN